VYVISGRDYSLTAVGFDRPNPVGNPTRSHSSTADFIQQYFNTVAFVANQPGRYGSGGRNPFRGPGASNVDLSLVKSFPSAKDSEAPVPLRILQHAKPCEVRPT
jgi:hypothetical protein